MKKIYLIMLAAITLMACSSTNEEESYLLFLYNNMSLPDRIDNDTAYYRAQVAAALTARAELPWGHDVPEREFRHFVLPPRVNNEDLDDFRQRYYAELRDRVKDLTMADAILEVNHWCHEHVTYRPTSARTLGPVSTIRTAYGRCGEESVLLVAALRTVGIPARQVYTPRWAHTDDNHAWVEAWADGRWHFLGACEPEPVLDLGWFNESASRGMLMHTRVFGNYDGPEEVVSRQTNLTEINVTANYAPTRRITVAVSDSTGHAVEGAQVEFKIYNYAEFYTVATKTTDAHGRCSLSAGRGDMLVWATAPPPHPQSPFLKSLPPTGGVGEGPQSSFAFRRVSFATDSLVTLTLRPTAKVLASMPVTIDITPPPASATLPSVSDAQRAENDRRLAVEDSLRHAYEATMTDQRVRGNQAIITAFLDSAAALDLTYYAEQLIAVLPDKDLQDITLPILLDNLPPSPSSLISHLSSSPTPTPPLGACDASQNSHLSSLISHLSTLYLLSPRIERERLTPFKAPLRAAFSTLLPSASSPSSLNPHSSFFIPHSSPSVASSSSPSGSCSPSSGSVDGGSSAVASLIAWTRDSITLIDDQNPQSLRMTPLGVFRSRTADRLGRDIFFVAACRSIGIPARINEINGKVQYYDTTWHDVTFDLPSPSGYPSLYPHSSFLNPHSSPARLILSYRPTRYVPDAQYYTHFTLSRLDDDNRLQLLTYPEEATVKNTFAGGVELDPGTYVLTTGTRLADGSVLAALQTITLRPGTTLRVPFTLREPRHALSVIGTLNAEHLYQPLTPSLSSLISHLSSPPTSLLSTTGRGYYILGLVAPGHEPTNHALRDIARVSEGFNKWGRSLVLLFDSPASAERFDVTEFYSPHPSSQNANHPSSSPTSPAGGSQGSSPMLPLTTVWGCDIDGAIRDELIASLHLPTSALPIFVVADSFNRVVYVSQGYTIGLGDQLIKVIKQLK